MVHRLMRALDAAGLDAGRHRLHALPLAGKNEPRTVGAKWRPPIRMPQDRRHVLHIRRKSSLASPSIRVSIHRPLRIRRESKPSPQKVYDTVKLGARLLNAEATGFAARGRKVSGHSSFLVGACRGLSRCKGGGRRNPPLSELQEIVGEADEAPLGGDLHDAAQQKLTEAARLLDLSEHRFGQLLS